MIHCLLYCSFVMEPRLSISDLFENRYLYVCAKYKTISDRYQGADKYIFYYRIYLFIAFNCTVVNQCEILGISKMDAYISHNLLHFQMLYN